VPRAHSIRRCGEFIWRVKPRRFSRGATRPVGDGTSTLNIGTTSRGLDFAHFQPGAEGRVSSMITVTGSGKSIHCCAHSGHEATADDPAGHRRHTAGNMVLAVLRFEIRAIAVTRLSERSA